MVQLCRRSCHVSGAITQSSCTISMRLLGWRKRGVFVAMVLATSNIGPNQFHQPDLMRTAAKPAPQIW
eukprot:1485806-Pleurochrysis_carterae.AAC.2